MPLARDLGLIPENQKTGPTNSISDVTGVMVGHKTIRKSDINTGVTAILPHGGNLFVEKVPAAVEVINGFGKSCGLMQVAELGSIETPILLTNTFGVGTCANALIKHSIQANPEIGRETSTVNPLVLECNDGRLSDIQAMAVTEDDAYKAISKACDNKCEQGSVGAGTGMICFGYKGGIGTSSRFLELDNKPYHLGVLVLSNFGSMQDLILPGSNRLDNPQKSEPDQGSIIIILATDIPLETRQLHRVVKRCGAGLARLGSVWGHGSGDIALGFSTGYKIAHNESSAIISKPRLNESSIDPLFKAAAEATQEAVLNSMTMSPAMTGRNQKSVPSLADVLRS